MSIHTFVFETIIKGKSEFTIDSYNNNELVDFLNENRVIDSFLYYYPNLILPGNKEAYSRRYTKKKIDELIEVIDIINELNINYVFLKGLAMKRYYPKFLNRQSNDFDFLIQNIEDFLILSDKIQSAGYELVDDFPFFTSEKETVMGVVKFKKELINDFPIYIEFNIGGFLISAGTWLNDPDLWERNQTIEINSRNFNIPSDEWNLILLIAEFGGNNYNRIRDAVDYYFMIESDIEIDKEYINKKRKYWCLNYQFNQFEYYYNKIISNQYVEENSFTKHTKHFFKMETEHIIPLTMKKMKLNSLIKLTFHYLRHIGEYFNEKNLFLGVLKKYENYLLPVKKVYDSGVHVHLIKVSNVKSTEWKILTLDKQSVIQNSLGSFLITNYGLHEDSELKMAVTISKEAQ